MKRIFWGMLLIMIDFGITNGAAFFDLLPDLLGVLLCLWGMAQLNDVWHRSKDLRIPLLLRSLYAGRPDHLPLRHRDIIHDDDHAADFQCADAVSHLYAHRHDPAYGKRQALPVWKRTADQLDLALRHTVRDILCLPGE